MKIKTKRKMIIVGLIILIIFCWRKSYFLFTPKIQQQSERIVYRELNTSMQALLKTNWEIEKEYVANLSPEERDERRKEKAERTLDERINRITDPFVTSPFLKTEEQKGFYKDLKFTYISSEYNWQRSFSNYYVYGNPIAFNQDFIVFLFGRGKHFVFWRTVSGSFAPILFEGPPLYIYLSFNTAKIGWNEIFIVDRKTGKIKEKYRIDAKDNIKKASLLPDNKLYIRTGNQVYIHQLP